MGIALLLTGCGADGVDGPPNLLDRLSPGPASRIVVVDLEAVREKLGVGALDPRAASFEDPAERSYSAIYGAAFPLVAQPRSDPVLDAVELGRVTAAAGNGYPGGRYAVTVLATDQPFDEIARALEDAGYTRDGAVLHKEGQTVAGGDGVVAVGRNAGFVRAAVDGTAEGIHGVARELVEDLAAPAAQAFEFGTDCPRAVALADGTDGAARLVVVTGAAAANHLTADDDGNPSFTGTRFDAPAADGDRVTADFTYAQDGRPPLTILAETRAEDLYDCG